MMVQSFERKGEIRNARMRLIPSVNDNSLMTNDDVNNGLRDGTNDYLCI